MGGPTQQPGRASFPTPSFLLVLALVTILASCAGLREARDARKAIPPGAPAPSVHPPQAEDPGRFPRIELDSFDARTVHPDARGFQLAVYDWKRERVLFLPWGPANRPLGVILAYDAQRDFHAPNSYQALDLTQLVHPAAQGFGAGFIDDGSDFVYLPPYRQSLNGSVVPNTLTVRINLNDHLADPAAYESFDLATLGLPQVGWAPGVYAEGSAYYSPVNVVGGVPHGHFVRYDASMAFDDPAAWSHFDLARTLHPRARGFQSIEAKPPWVYLIPYGIGFSHLVRYNIQARFDDPSAYEVFDLTTIDPDAKGFTGGVVVGDYLVLVPWRDLTRPRGRQSTSVALAFDTRMTLADPEAWSSIDLTNVHPQARGYQFGWVHEDRFAYLVPTANFEIGRPPPFVVWDSTQPFHLASSWATYPSQGVPPSTGAAYDGSTYAWLAPYGIDGDSGLITRVRAGE